MLNWIKKDPFIHICFLFFIIILILGVGTTVVFRPQILARLDRSTALHSGPLTYEPSTFYTITKVDLNYWLLMSKKEIKIADPRNYPGTYLIGKSKVDLESFLGKRVKVSGSYVKYTTDKQCIVNKCHLKINSAVVDIDSIEKF